MKTRAADRPSEYPEYLGDGCYVRFDGFSLWLTAENGAEATDEICLEPSTYAALVEYVASLKTR